MTVEMKGRQGRCERVEKQKKKVEDKERVSRENRKVNKEIKKTLQPPTELPAGCRMAKLGDCSCSVSVEVTYHVGRGCRASLFSGGKTVCPDRF